MAEFCDAEKDLWKVRDPLLQVLCLDPQISRLTKSAKKEAEDWARQTKRTLVMEMIKQRKHTWISRPKRQVLFLAKSLGQFLIYKFFSEK